jgi:hypothetical protein
MTRIGAGRSWSEVGECGGAVGLRSVATVEDAARAVLMMQLRAGHRVGTKAAEIPFGREQHAERRRREVNPKCGPELGRKGGRKGACRIDAHAGERRLDPNVDRDQDTGGESGLRAQSRVI